MSVKKDAIFTDISINDLMTTPKETPNMLVAVRKKPSTNDLSQKKEQGDPVVFIPSEFKVQVYISSISLLVNR